MPPALARFSEPSRPEAVAWLGLRLLGVDLGLGELLLGDGAVGPEPLGAVE